MTTAVNGCLLLKTYKKRKDDTKNEIKMVIKMLSNITNILAFPFYFLLYLFYNYKAAYFFMLWIQQDILTKLFNLDL